MTTLKSWSLRTWQQICRRNPFDGDTLPSRVPLLGYNRPTQPFPHPWNFRTPLKILDTYFHGVDNESNAGKHNRYFDVVGFDPVLVSRDPGIIKAILLATGDKPGQFDRDTLPTTGIARATGEDTLLYSNGPFWRTQKKLAAPSFGRSNLFQPEKFHDFEQTFRHTAAERLSVLRTRQQESGENISRVELEPEINVVMLEMLVNNFFGGNISYEELRDRFVPSLIKLIDYMVVDTIKSRMTVSLAALTGESAALKRARADFEELTDIALAGRAEGAGMWEKFKSDATNEQLRSNIRVFIAGALEATSSFAGWTLSHLSRAPELQEKIYQEVKSMDVYDPDNLAQATTLKSALEETLRLTPSLYFLPRLATVDTWVETTDGRRMRIPKGTHILLDVWHANRCEDFWGKEISGYAADEYAPARWDVLAEKGFSPRDIVHFGFGLGPRTCPGISLGLLEVGLVVGAFVKMFKFSAANPTVGATAAVSTKPDDAVAVNLELRTQ